MYLELDAGNTRMKWRVVDVAGSALGRGFVLYPEFEDFVEKLCLRHSIREVFVSSVLSDDRNVLFDSVLRRVFCDLPVSFVVSSQQLMGVQFCYADVSRLGVDRCLAMVAAYSANNDGCVVLDCGSAITADFVTAEGVHLGGYILPGLSMLREGLLKGTDKVAVDGRPEFNIELGRDTDTCVEHGVCLMFKSSLLSIVEVARQHGLENVITTGGDGGLASSLLGGVCFEPELVLDGLHLVVMQDKCSARGVGE